MPDDKDNPRPATASERPADRPAERPTERPAAAPKAPVVCGSCGHMDFDHADDGACEGVGCWCKEFVELGKPGAVDSDGKSRDEAEAKK